MQFRLIAICLSLVVLSIKSLERDAWAADAEEQDTDKNRLADRHLAFMVRHVESYTGTRKADGAKLTALPKALLRWSNPLVNIEHGLYVAWTDPSGRPMSVAQIYFFPSSKKWFIEHQSLCDGPMEFTSELHSTWSPQSPGIEWTKIGNEDMKPVESKPLRLTQMRQLARRFRAEDTIANNSKLRLLTSPVMRYDAAEKGLIDGALFVMVNGTDPEITLQIEARQDQKSGRHYYWALSPMTTYELRAYIGDKEVWHSLSSRSMTADDIFHPHPIDGQVE